MPKCIRNLLGEGHKATEVVKVAYGEGIYELDLCGEHARQMDDQLWGWLRLAREVSTEGFFDGAGLSERLREAPAVREGLPEKFLTAAETHEELPVSKTEMDIIRIRWTLTEHAWERVEERSKIFGFTIEDVLLAAEKPERSHMDREGRSRAGEVFWVHWRGNVKAVVNRQTKTIITVGGKEQVAATA
jgi:hypothetical protein